MGWLFWRCLEVRIERGGGNRGRGVVDERERREEGESGQTRVISICGNFKGPSWVESWLRV